MPRTSTSSNTPTRLGWPWWLLGITLLLLFIAVQIPASWLLAKLAPQQNVLRYVTGNLWHGQGQLQIQRALQPVSIGVEWRLKPFRLLLLEGAWQVELTHGRSELNGILGLRRQTWRVGDLSGQIEAQTLSDLLAWRWPSVPLQVYDVNLGHEKRDFTAAAGQLKWAGGILGYPFQGKQEQLNLPPLNGRLALDSPKTNSAAAGTSRVHLALTNQAGERMGDFYWGADQFVEAQLTQRFLTHLQGYQGQAGLDTAVISTRLPASALGQP